MLMLGHAGVRAPRRDARYRMLAIAYAIAACCTSEIEFVKPTCLTCWDYGFAIVLHPAVPLFACWAPSEPACCTSEMPKNRFFVASPVCMLGSFGAYMLMLGHAGVRAPRRDARYRMFHVKRLCDSKNSALIHKYVSRTLLVNLGRTRWGRVRRMLPRGLLP